MTADEMKSCTVSRAEFGRIIGVTACRIGQLVKVGLLVTDGATGDIELYQSLKRYWAWRTAKRFAGLTIAEFMRELNRHGDI